MANHKSAVKRVRQSAKRRERNRYFAKTARNSVRQFEEITDPDEAQAKLPEVMSQVDKLAKKNIIHKRKAANLKSKLMKRLNSLQAGEDHTGEEE